MIIELAVNGVLSNVYTHRSYLLYSLYPSEDYVIDGNINIGTLLSSLLESHESTVVTQSCMQCKNIVKSNVFTLPNLNIAWKDNHLNL